MCSHYVSIHNVDLAELLDYQSTSFMISTAHDFAVDQLVALVIISSQPGGDFDGISV